MDQGIPAEIQILSPNDPSPKHTIQQILVIENEVPYQKQTSSQLIHFLKTSGKVSNDKYGPETTKGSIRHLQQQSIKPTASGGQKVISSASDKTDMKRGDLLSEIEVSKPIFAVKNSSSDCVAYRWMIATNSELWDIGDIFTDINYSFTKPFQNNMMDFHCQGDRKVPNHFSQSICPVAEESLSMEQVLKLGACRDPNIFIGQPEDGDGVHVKIPEFQIRKFEEIPVVITHIINPNKFFIQHRNTDLCELSEIMLHNKSSRSFAEMNHIPDIGAYVMAWLPKQELWCRAQVSKICGLRGGTNHKDFKNIKVEVRRIDYGDVACLSLGNIKELCGEIASRPMQALQVSLAYVRPVNGENWSDEAICWLKNKVENRTLYARLYPEGCEVLVELFMEKGKIGAMRRGASLSGKLAQHGYARHEHKKTKGLRRSHAQEQARLRSLDWEKYLVSCYCQKRI